MKLLAVVTPPSIYQLVYIPHRNTRDHIKGDKVEHKFIFWSVGCTAVKHRGTLWWVTFPHEYGLCISVPSGSWVMSGLGVGRCPWHVSFSFFRLPWKVLRYHLLLLEMVVTLTDPPPDTQYGSAISATFRGGTGPQNCNSCSLRMPSSCSYRSQYT